MASRSLRKIVLASDPRAPSLGRSTRMLALLAIGPALVACSGQVGEPGMPIDMPPSPTGTGGTGVISDKPPAAGTDPGRITVHRLNKTEYNNTVSDLLMTPLHTADAFPAVNLAAGYDNIADALTLSLNELPQYRDAAETLSELVVGAQRAKLVACDPVAMGDACVQSTIKAFGKRAWRRPLADDEVAGLMMVAATAKAQGDTPLEGLKLAIQALLFAPQFLFRVELDPTPTSMAAHALTDYELASRLSYFLWSSMPDDELFAAADAGNLHDKNVLAAQVTRMLKSTKASALVDNFAGQWLFSRGVASANPDKTLFPKFDAPLQAAMLQEAQLMFRDVAFGGGSAQELLTANYTYLNDRLAQHYGMAAVGSAEMKKVTLTDNKRGGVLSQGSFLTVTSHANSTSPVKRGKAIMSQLLCTEVPDPPKDVNTTLGTSMTGTTLREQLESHRADVKCSGCHSLMDPLGFGLENYDAVGAYRTTDQGKMVDSSGTFLDGQKFTGAHELATLVSTDKRFAACITEQLYTYALGRAPVQTPGHMDPAVLWNTANDFSKAGLKFETLVQRMVAADTFLKRRGEPVTGGSQ
jgi:hypothetical protein